MVWGKFYYSTWGFAGDCKPLPCTNCWACKVPKTLCQLLLKLAACSLMRCKERLLVFKASFYSDDFVLPENATEITFHYEASQVLVHHIFLWRQKSNSNHGQDCQSDFSQLLKQVMLLWKPMIGIFRRNQAQIVCKELLCQLLAYGCFILVSGANPAQSPGLRVQLWHWALLFVSVCCTK